MFGVIFKMPYRFEAILRAAVLPLCSVIFTLLKITISCLDDLNARNAI
jgi:hypothetical protein